MGEEEKISERVGKLLHKFIIWGGHNSILLFDTTEIGSKSLDFVQIAESFFKSLGANGINMKRGFGEIKKMLPEYKELEVSEILTKCAMTLMTKVGGASGPLYGTAFMKAGTALKGKDENEILNNSVLCNALNEAVTGIKERGKAEKGDKTMIDVLIPALEEFSAAQETESKKEILKRMVKKAREALEYTKTIPAKKGRASYLGERSIGTEDPGAYSSYLILKSISENL